MDTAMSNRYMWSVQGRWVYWCKSKGWFKNEDAGASAGASAGGELLWKLMQVL